MGNKNEVKNMNEFRLRIYTSGPSELEEYIKVFVDRETFISLRKIIKDFLEAREYL